MPRLDYKRCKRCGRHSDDVGVLSHTRLCLDCGASRLDENMRGLSTMTGPAVPRWRRGMIACAGGVLPDDLRANAQNGA